MRILKLQMQMTIDGFVAGPQGQLDWMSFNWNDDLVAFVNEFTDSGDTILMGRKMTDGFINYWENVVNNQPESPEFEFAKKMVDLPKIVFSKTQLTIAGKNVAVENGDLVTAVNVLKAKPGKDIIVYGGAGFVSSLIDHNLIDELYLYTNPIAIGDGMRIFNKRHPLQLAASTAYKNGIVVNKYVPAGQ
ncbi:dihydrofolate reductase family protein [Terrimonas pollutisoli]|uniref:dihydrofolate reductase family protein n=1 Tax=Terrimonas pollutisoli TaxID=3034147 RepID=UPI0023EB0A16|nr:dihydrofolate reductase family protein [Terrimonas sp. H1YJ31]